MESFMSIDGTETYVEVDDSIITEASLGLKSKKRYEQRYRKQWEQIDKFQGWLAPVPGLPTMAYCKSCKTGICARKKDISDHAKSRKHQRRYYNLENDDITDILTAALSASSEGSVLDENTEFTVDDESGEILVTNPKVRMGQPSFTFPRNSVKSESPKKCSIEIVDSDGKVETEETSKDCCGCCHGDDFLEFGKYVGNELRTVKNYMAMQKAKYEINRILYSVTTGEYSNNTLNQNTIIQVSGNDVNSTTLEQEDLENLI